MLPEVTTDDIEGKRYHGGACPRILKDLRTHYVYPSYAADIHTLSDTTSADDIVAKEEIAHNVVTMFSTLLNNYTFILEFS